MKKDKIVIAISDSFCANFIKGQASYMQTRGYEVIIVSAPGPEINKLAKDENARLVIIPFSREISLLNDVKSLYLVIKFLMKEKPSLVNAGNPKTGFLFMLSKFFFPKIPMVFTLRGLRSDTLTGFKRRVVKFTEWVSCTIANDVIVISPSLKKHATDIGVLKENKGVVLGKGSSNGIDVDKFTLNIQSQNLGRKLRKTLNIDVNDIVIGHVGRITKDKGIEELYKAFKICEEIHSNIKLILTGPIEKDDSISDEILDLILNDPKIYPIGKMMNVNGVYAAYDIFVLFSHREGFGNVALEAASMSKPVIVSNIPGAKDTTEHMKSGLHVSSRDANELAKAIQFYIDNPEMRIIHGDYGAKRARDHFSSQIIWDGQYELYKSLINE